MKRKIYININLFDKTKRRLARGIEKWQNLPIKWTKEDNLCVTLFFLGYVDNEVVLDICQKVRSAVESLEIFDLEFEGIALMPSIEKAQSVWITGKSSEQLKVLQSTIEKKLGIFISEKKTFSPHITLGKIRKSKWEELAVKPEINESISFAVET